MKKSDSRPPQLLAPLSRAALEDLLTAKGPPTCDRLPPIIQLRRCAVCKEWLTEGSRERGQCGACGVWMEPTA